MTTSHGDLMRELTIQGIQLVGGGFEVKSGLSTDNTSSMDGFKKLSQIVDMAFRAGAEHQANLVKAASNAGQEASKMFEYSSQVSNYSFAGQHTEAAEKPGYGMNETLFRLRREAAAKVLEDYDFGDEWIFEASSGWEDVDADTVSCPVFLGSVDKPEADTIKVDLIVKFESGSTHIAAINVSDLPSDDCRASRKLKR